MKKSARPAPPTSLTPRTLLRFLAEVKDEFIADKCLRTASALSYTTLLSLVPLMAVILATFSAFPAFHDVAAQLELYIFKHFVPALSSPLREHLAQFSEKAAGLRTAGIIVLIFTVLAMMETIDSALNGIWGIRARRSRIATFLVYWAVLTLGPLLIGAGLVATSYLVSLPLVSRVESSLGLKEHLLAWAPVVLSWIAFTVLYMLVPNRRVPLRLAVFGGLIASGLFEVAKRGFAFYITHFPAHEAVYGAFASIPIFLMWIYLSWLVILLGAEITYCLETFSMLAERSPAGSTERLRNAVRVLGHLWRAQQRGEPMTEADLLALEPAIGYARLDRTLERLSDGHWVQRNEPGTWLVIRDLGEASLEELCLALGGVGIALQKPLQPIDTWDRNLESVLQAHQACVDRVLAQPVKALFEPRSES